MPAPLAFTAARWLFPAALAAVVLAWWWYGSGVASDGGAEPAAAHSGDTLPPPARQGVGHAPPAHSPVAAAGDEADRQVAAGRFWESVERYCPWPPEPSAWRVLDDPCLSVMNRRNLNEDWLRALDDPLAAWQAVAEALARPECVVPEGEIRPDLHEACAAGAMVQLALLQTKCARRVRQDPEEVFAYGRRQVDQADGQEEYHHWVEDNHRANAQILWEVYMCRTVPREALEWVDAIPAPEGDAASLTGWRKVVSVENEDGSGAVMTIWLETTQRSGLYAAAQRLGATVH